MSSPTTSVNGTTDSNPTKTPLTTSLVKEDPPEEVEKKQGTTGLPKEEEVNKKQGTTSLVKTVDGNSVISVHIDIQISATKPG